MTSAAARARPGLVTSDMFFDRLAKKARQPLDRFIRRLGYIKSTDKPSFESDIFGHKMFVSPSDDGVNLHGINGQAISQYKYGEIALAAALPRGATVVDCGANVGFFTLLFARSVGDHGRVYSFEPGPLSFALLSKNVAINGYRNVTLVNKAISSSSGTTDFFLCRTGESDNTMFDTPGEERDRISMTTVSLDDYFGGTPIDFIKIDIQGSEYLALQGMTGVLENNPKIQLLMEYSPSSLEMAGVNPTELVSRISSLGFSIFVVYEDRPSERVDAPFLLTSCGRGRKFPHLNLLLRRQTT
jgi:FkbM family methyltransferase